MEDLASAQAEISRLQEQLAETKSNAESRIETMRMQQLEARNRAKAIIQKQRQQTQEKVAEYEKTVKAQAAELERFKGVEGDRDRLRDRTEELDALVISRGTDLEKVLEEKAACDRKIANLQEELSIKRDESSSHRVTLEQKITDLENKLCQQTEAEARRQNVGALEAANVSVDRDLEEAKARILELERVCEELRTENARMAKTSVNQDEVASGLTGNNENGISLDHDRQATSSRDLRTEAREAKEQAERLVEEVAKTKEEFRDKQKDLEVLLDESRKENKDLEQKLLDMEKQLSETQETLRKSELALQTEREKVLSAQRNASEAITNGDEGKKMLEAKIAEMERVISSKQADIAKVREKARTYLKDINAEKREMEERMKKKVEGLQGELAQSEEKLKAAESRAEATASELDNCLALIRDKQKIIQMLRMTISTEIKGAEEARRATEAVRAEFAAYKERARVALKEKSSTAESSSDIIEEATQAARQDLEKTRKENAVLREQIADLREAQGAMDKLRERAEKAEAAVDLLRKDVSGFSQTLNYSQVDILEEKLAATASELRAAQSGCADAEDRHQTTKMRLEAAERALRGTEVRAEEAARLSARTIAGLQEEVERLEQELDRAIKSSAAAQRTAAAAAKALTFNESGNPSRVDASYQDLMKSPTSQDKKADELIEVTSHEGMEPSRATFLAAMEGYSDSLGLNMGHSSVVTELEGTSKADIVSRDKQIAVLTSQVAELGALLDEAQQETTLKSEQTDLLKTEVKNLDAKLAAAERLKNGAPFSYLRTIVVRYLETEDPTLLPVISNVLSFTDEENERVKNGRGSGLSVTSTPGSSQKSSYFSLSFLGS